MGAPWNGAYFEPILGALRNLSGEREYELRLVTDERAPRFTLDWQGIPVVWRRWASATEAADVREFDIGLMPLVDDPWTRGKCGLKAIQYLAAGVPAVVSPVGVNREIVRDGQNGYWAATPEQWLDRLRRLLDDPSERARLGAKGREHVERHYSIQAWFEPWLKAVLGRSSP